MLKQLISAIKSAFRSVTKIARWVQRRGQNGNNPVTPLSAQWLSTGWSFVVITGFGIANGTYRFIVNYLLEGVGFLLTTLADIGKDLWNSDHKFTRWAVASSLSLAATLVSTVSVTARTVGALVVAAMVFIFNKLR